MVKYLFLADILFWGERVVGVVLHSAKYGISLHYWQHCCINHDDQLASIYDTVERWSWIQLHCKINLYHSSSPTYEKHEKHILTKLVVQIENLLSKSCKNSLCSYKLCIAEF